jgi:hypothetical protein
MKKMAGQRAMGEDSKMLNSKLLNRQLQRIIDTMQEQASKIDSIRQEQHLIFDEIAKVNKSLKAIDKKIDVLDGEFEEKNKSVIELAMSTSRRVDRIEELLTPPPGIEGG